MKSRTKVVVSGSRIAGCSTLYHLTREGWSDAVLIERDELTSGTTWHSAAHVTNFAMNPTMVGLKSHAIKLYKERADDPEYSTASKIITIDLCGSIVAAHIIPSSPYDPEFTQVRA